MGREAVQPPGCDRHPVDHGHIAPEVEAPGGVRAEEERSVARAAHGEMNVEVRRRAAVDLEFDDALEQGRVATGPGGIDAVLRRGRTAVARVDERGSGSLPHRQTLKAALRADTRPADPGGQGLRVRAEGRVHQLEPPGQSRPVERLRHPGARVSPAHDGHVTPRGQRRAVEFRGRGRCHGAAARQIRGPVRLRGEKHQPAAGRHDGPQLLRPGHIDGVRTTKGPIGRPVRAQLPSQATHHAFVAHLDRRRAHHDVTVARLTQQGDGLVEARPEDEGGVDAPLQVQPGEPVHARTAIGREAAAHVQLGPVDQQALHVGIEAARIGTNARHSTQ